jgi:magnesium transporter
MTVLMPFTRDDGQGLRVEALAVVAGPTWIVTCSRPAPGHRDDLIAAVGARLGSLGEPGVGDAVTVVVDEAVDRLWDVSDDLADRLAAAERTSLDDAVAAHQALQALRRDILVLHQAVGPLRRALASLIEEHLNGLDVAHVSDVRQSHDAVIELRGQIDTQLLLLNGLSQTQVVTASHRANEVMQATSSWGAILVVATLITGVYGMNFRVMPELRWEFGYPFAIALIVMSTAALYGLFKFRGWL